MDCTDPCPYDWRDLYAELSLDAKARLAARHLASLHGTPPNGPQVVAWLLGIDAKDRIHRGAAWRAAREQRRVMKLAGLTRKTTDMVPKSPAPVQPRETH